ncbi:metallophosphoesterase family protein [Paenibacillus daejeonensis]|uniref:metallophosphoesterase family protein n=1 Tax=Paenibacillus daejeonensis TaxID=135193 RepID=UPI0003786BEB|nr:metallophosphoesterase [Paenibacillus daejeonensis]
MQIAIISDTHMPARAKGLPEALKRGLAKVDLILHAGDWTSRNVYEMLSEYAPVDGIAGNNDGPEIVNLLGYRKIVPVAGRRIGLVHGHGRSGTTESRAIDAFAGDQVDVIVFGHSHTPLYKKHNGVILINPGSPTDKRRQPSYSYGLLNITSTSLDGEIVYYDSKQ